MTRTRSEDHIEGCDPVGQIRLLGRRNTRRVEVQRALLTWIRRTSSLIQLTTQAAADRLRINVTDLHCLNIVSLNGPMTAGQLARAAGLTTASITGVIDRLEEAGYAGRERDPRDRRRVVIRLITHAVARDVAPVFAPALRAWQELAAGYTDAELELIEGYQRRSVEIMREHLALMRGRARPVDTNGRFGTGGGADPDTDD